MAKPSEDTKLSILVDHYKETVAGLKSTGKVRDNNFLVMLVLLGVMAFQFVSPNHSQSLLTQIVDKKAGINAPLSISFLGSLTWFALLYVAIRYFQAVINLEKQYNYTHDLEDQISPYYDGKAFTREGKEYLKNYPVFSDWIHIIYRTIIPLLLIATITVKIFAEWFAKSTAGIPIALDTILYIILTVSTVLYMYALHKTKKHSEFDITK